jgi:hypothetical protein
MKTKAMESKPRYSNLSEPAPYPCNIRTAFSANDKTDPIHLESEQIKPICILADKVYSYCQQRDCFPSFKVTIEQPIEQIQLIAIYFQQGYIAEKEPQIIPIGPKRPHFSRIKFTLKVPYTIQFRNQISNEIINMSGLLPDILKDVVLFTPESRNEFNYKIVVETRTETLAAPQMRENFIEIPIGIFSIIRVVGRTEIFIPAYCSTPEPPEGESFKECEESICKDFKERPFPDDFFPPKFQDFDI